MIDRDYREELAQCRLALRAIDTEIEQLQQDRQFYRQLGFGRDLQDMRMMALVEQRQAYLTQLAEVGGDLQRNGSLRSSFASWLLLPLALVVILARSAFASGRRP